MLDGTLNKRVKRVYSPEQWAEARSLYQGGMSLEGVAEKLGIPYSTVQYRAWVESWGVRSRGGRRDPRYQLAKARRIEAKLEREEALMVSEATLVKAEDLEVLARKSLVADSARLKVVISRRVGEIVARLDDPSVPVRSAAQALGALASILKLLYRWDQEPSLVEMKRPWSQAINLELIKIGPEELERRAKAKEALETQRTSTGVTEHNGQVDGAHWAQREQPPGAGNGQLTPKKEAPSFLAKQPTQRPVQGNPPSPSTPQTDPGASQNALKPSVQQASVEAVSPTLSPEERRRLELEELARLRAEWRRR
jgi:hypothetical protein